MCHDTQQSSSDRSELVARRGHLVGEVCTKSDQLGGKVGSDLDNLFSNDGDARAHILLVFACAHQEIAVVLCVPFRDGRRIHGSPQPR